MARKIFFEGIGLVEGHFSGIGQYILGTLRGIDEIIEQEKTAGRRVPKIEVIIPYDTRAKFNGYGFKHLRPKLFPMPFRVIAGLWHRGKMPPIDLYCGPGYYIFTRFVTMPLAFSNSAVVIYDLSFELHRQYSDEGNAIFLTRSTRKSIKQVDTIFTISQNARKEVREVYKVPNDKIIVATPAADQRYFYRRSPQEIATVRAKYGINNNYILALSNLEPRKNLETLVDAYCDLPEDYRKKYSLLLVGVNAWRTDKLFQKIVERVKQGYDIIRPSEYVSDKDKPAIISGASMLVYPSHYEGFGMPPLEAMACGVPVITSDNSSLPEVVGKVGVMLDRLDTAGYTRTMKKYLDNLDEMTKKSIIEGSEQASKFSWEASARLYWEVIQEKMR
ncbi:glycosyl transferase 1, group 1 [candidate division TM7 genomosp. GTL1]|nr:glycosyl transferase 1, group 1 [candidate division TM7 genomosp. GTL1]